MYIYSTTEAKAMLHHGIAMNTIFDYHDVVTSSSVLVVHWPYTLFHNIGKHSIISYYGWAYYTNMLSNRVSVF